MEEVTPQFFTYYKVVVRSPEHSSEPGFFEAKVCLHSDEFTVFARSREMAEAFALQKAVDALKERARVGR